jgi:molybdopterin molybdotransferase
MTDDCFAAAPAMLSLAAAHALLAERVPATAGIEHVGLRHGLGRILAEDVVSPLAQPPFANAAMDGFALRHADLSATGSTILPLADRVAAGHPATDPVPAGSAVEIFTGAPMPEGLDTVVMMEDCRVEAAPRRVHLPANIRPGQHTRPAGEDFAAGDTVLTSGRRLRPQDIAMLAAVGRTEIAVFERLRVAVFSTGDELVEPGRALAPGQIFDSNRYGLLAVLDALGCAAVDLGHLPDDAGHIAAALAQAAGDHHAVLTSGGVSVGGEDHVKAAIARIGTLHFWKIALKPGKPVALGQIGGTAFLGLPGNPVSALVTLLVVGRPLLLRLAGAAAEPALPRPMVLSSGFSSKHAPGRRQFLRASVTEKDGKTVVNLFPNQGSGVLSSLIHSDGLVDIGENSGDISDGDPVAFHSYQSLLW